MTNLNVLQSELAALTERVNSAMELTKGEITLTREQLKQLINKVQEQTKEYINTEIDDMRFDEDDYVELDLCGREIELNFNEDSLKQDIKHNIGGPEDIEDSELDKLLNNIKEAQLCVQVGVRNVSFFSYFFIRNTKSLIIYLTYKRNKNTHYETTKHTNTTS